MNLLRRRCLAESFYRAGEFHESEILQAICMIDAPEHKDFIKYLLLDRSDVPFDGTSGISHAITLASLIGDDTLIHDIYELLLHLGSWGTPVNSNWTDAAKVLLNDPKYRERVEQQLLRVEPNGDVALLAIEHKPEYAPAIFAKAIRSEDCKVLLFSVAALAILDEAWSRELLMNALNDAPRALPSVLLRAAIRMSSDDDMRSEADRWEAAHHSELPVEPNSYHEYQLSELATQAERLRPRVVDLRGRVSR